MKNVKPKFHDSKPISYNYKTVFPNENVPYMNPSLQETKNNGKSLIAKEKSAT